jgi:hypothetical protein
MLFERVLSRRKNMGIKDRKLLIPVLCTTRKFFYLHAHQREETIDM